MENQDELIAQFIDISGSDEDIAKFYLSSSNWSLEEALSNFLSNHPEDSQRVGESTSTLDVNAQPSNKGNTKGEPSDSFNKKSSKLKFATLNDMAENSSDNEEGQAFYAGGSERSGQQVLGPPKRKNFRDQLTDMFRMAQEHHSSAEVTPTPSTSSGANWGQGVRLGMTTSDHSIVDTPTKNSEQAARPIVVLKLWSQGFSINDGELRLYDDPENKEFLETVMRGEIPTELLEMGWMVNVDVEDHRQEEYKKKSVSSKTFKGSGHTLGSPAPNIEEDTAVSTLPSSLTSSADDQRAAEESLNVDASAPTTSIQIRLADGSRITAQFNLTHTVEDIHRFIQNARPQYENRNYILVTCFPTRELNDISVTIEDAGLKNAALMQRLK